VSADIRSLQNGRWKRRLLRWRSSNLLMRADEQFGDYRHESDEQELERAELVARYGSIPAAKADPAGREAWESLWARMSATEERRNRRFIARADRAAAVLMLTPAPDMEAIELKIEVIKEHELDNWKGMPREPIDVIAEDLRRLATGAGRGVEA
jgi:hypothetical protein